MKVVSFKHRPISPGEKVDGTHSVGDWVGLGVGLQVLEKIKYPVLSHRTIEPRIDQPACMLVTILTGIPERSVISIPYKKFALPL
jgi:hypothetical protein